MVALLAWLALGCDAAGPEDSKESGPDTAATDTASGADTGDSAGDTDTADTQDTADQDGDGVPVPDDCDDADATVYPGAAERCDPTDHDCDGEALAPGVCGGDVDLATVSPRTTLTSSGGMRSAWAVHGLERSGVDTLVFATSSGLVPVDMPVEGEWDVDDVGLPRISWGDRWPETLRVVGDAGDFNGDGYGDVLYMATGNFEIASRVAVLPGPASAWPRDAGIGDVAFGEWFEEEDLRSSFGAFGAGGGDVDGDGLADVIAESTTEDDDFVLIVGRTEGGTFAPGDETIDASTDSYHQRGWFPGDLDGDGLSEVACERGTPDSSRDDVRITTGDAIPLGQVSSWSDFSTVASTEGCDSASAFQETLGDWTGDGHDDLIVYCVHSLAEDEIFMLDGGLLPIGDSGTNIVDVSPGGWTLPSDVGLGFFEPGDVDGDGIPDLPGYVGEGGDTQISSIIFLSSFGVPAPGSDLPEDAPRFGTTEVDPTWWLFPSLPDLDGDGLADPTFHLEATSETAVEISYISLLGWELPWGDPAYW